MSDEGPGAITPKEEKKAAFDANPDEFVAIKDLIVGAIVNSNGEVMVTFNPSPHKRNILLIAKGQIDHLVSADLVRRDLAQAVRDKKIVLPKNTRGAFGLGRLKR